MNGLKERCAAGCLLALCLPWIAVAQPSSNVAFTDDTLRRLDTGDADRGQQVATDCISCHGSEGVSPSPNWPNLAGQLKTYLYKQMRDYKDGKRRHPIMTPLAETFSEQEISDLAAYFSDQSTPAPQVAASGEPSFHVVGTAEAAGALEDPRLASRGDGSRFLPPCAACHGAKGEGRSLAVPALAGQPARYFRETMLAYKNGERSNDVYSVMRSIARELTEQEIELLAAYYATLDAR